MSSPNILVISFSYLDRDPRVRRQLTTLAKQNYTLTAAGFSNPAISGVEWWPLKPSKLNLFGKIKTTLMLKAKLFNKYYWQLATVRSLLAEKKSRSAPTFDLIIANDIESLPVALSMANGKPVLIDAHEYAPSQSGSWVWEYIFQDYVHWQCKTYLPKASAMSTICAGIADLYRKNFGIQSFLTYNTPHYSELTPSDIDPQNIRLVHHGVALAHRKLEVMIDMIALLDERFTLNFYLVANTPKARSYLSNLKRLTEKLNLNHRITFNLPVDTDEIASKTNQYDIGVFPMEPKCFNQELTLPNKFFEFVQARLAIAIGPSQEMVKLIREFDLGVVARDFSAKAMADAVSSLSVEEIYKYKQNSNSCAKSLSFEGQVPQFIDTVQKLINAKPLPVKAE